MLQAILAEKVNNMDQSACLLKYMLLSGRMESKNRISLLSQGLPL